MEGSREERVNQHQIWEQPHQSQYDCGVFNNHVGESPGNGNHQYYRDERDFNSQCGGFSGNNSHPDDHHHRKQHHNRRRDYQHSNGFRGGSEEHSHQCGGPPDDSFSGVEFGHGHGHPRPHLWRKRRHPNFDHAGRGNYVKVFVGGIPRTVTEQDIRAVFGEYGTIIEVVLVRAKITSQPQEYCFVKFAALEEADKAVIALHNKYAFVGVAAPIRVKYADGERERLGAPEHKVYVNNLNKQASPEEIEKIFTYYGAVEEVYIMRDDFWQSRGCGFVGFSHRDMATAAINGLNGTYVMRGCDRPLIVRFAEPKRPKNLELRPAPDCGVHGAIPPNASHLSNSCPPAHTKVAVMPPNHGTPVAIQRPHHGFSGHPIHPRPHVAPWFSQTSSVGPMSEGSSQSLNQVDTPVPSGQASTGTIERHCDSELVPTQSRWPIDNHQMPIRASAKSNAVQFSSDSTGSMVPGSNLMEGLPDCDWSEHVCPDGHKYYYNCATYESRWEKPEELALYEKKLQIQGNVSSIEPQSVSDLEAPFGKINCETPISQYAEKYPHQENSDKALHCVGGLDAEKVHREGPAVLQQGLSAV